MHDLISFAQEKYLILGEVGNRNSINSLYVGRNWGSEIQRLDPGHTAGYLQSQDPSFPAISTKSQFPLALLLSLG